MPKSGLSLEEKLKGLEALREELFKRQEPIKVALVANYDEIEKLKDEISKIKIAKMKKPDWNVLLEENTGMVMYKKCDAELTARGLLGGGSLLETGQRCIKVMLTRGDPTSYHGTINALKEILPHIKPFPEGKHVGYKFIDIFESTLSANGTYYMLIKDDSYKLMRSRFHHEEKLKSFKSLEEIITHVQVHHPHEDKQ